MSNNNPMSQEQLDAIQRRVDVMNGNPPVDIWAELVGARKAPAYHAAPQDLAVLLAEVERLRALTTVDDAKIERVARNLANLEPGEAWPTTRELGGDPRSVRDEEYRAAMREWAQKVINMSLGADEDEWSTNP